MTHLGKIERVYVAQTGAVLSPPFNPPLPNGGVVNLAAVTVNLDCDRDSVLLQAVVNWSATFANALENALIGTAGSVDVTFEILRDGQIIYQVTDTAVQKVSVANLFVGSTTTSVVTPLLFLDFCVSTGCNTYTLRAANIVVTPPALLLPSGPATGLATAGVGAVTLVAAKTEGKHR